MKIEALTFDVGGTVFDWQTAVRTKVGALAEARDAQIDVAQFALDWRLRFFQLLGLGHLQLGEVAAAKRRFEQAAELADSDDDRARYQRKLDLLATR